MNLDITAFKSTINDKPTTNEELNTKEFNYDNIIVGVGVGMMAVFLLSTSISIYYISNTYIDNERTPIKFAKAVMKLFTNYLLNSKGEDINLEV